MSLSLNPIRGLLLDWAGTTVDYGSRAPARVFVEVFARSGVPVTEAEARGPMGMAKHEHIAAVMRLPRVTEAWKLQYGTEPGDTEVQRLYEEFLPLQLAVLGEYSTVIPGVPEAIAWCRGRGLKIGSSTGYTRALMAAVLPVAAAGGYAPDVVVCSDEVAAGRPAPWLNFRVAEKLGLYPMRHLLVVDDTPLGIAAGKAAGCQTVAISRSGNSLGLTLAETEALPPAKLAARLAAIDRDFRSAGADHVLHSVADLPALLADRSSGLIVEVTA
ncbi:MAG: phosphonoacetaldehyde hydrolase [Planctomycetota bacterium]|nr:phosphonoacetaldehyde hydrolase [Planctomycetota bacterium]